MKQNQNYCGSLGGSETCFKENTSLPLVDRVSLRLVGGLPPGFGSIRFPLDLHGCTGPQVLGRFGKILKLKHLLLRIRKVK